MSTAYLNDVRDRLGLETDADLARVLGVSGQHIKEVKRGHRIIGRPLASAIRAALNAVKGAK